MIIRAIVIGTLFIGFNLSAINVTVLDEASLSSGLNDARLIHFKSLAGVLAGRNMRAQEIGRHIDLVVRTYYKAKHRPCSAMQDFNENGVEADRDKLVEIFLPDNPDAQAEAKSTFITYRGK